MMINDYLLIDELQYLEFSLNGLPCTRNDLGGEAVRQNARDRVQATEKRVNVIAVTHVPLFREAAWYRRRVSDDNWLSHFSCKAIGAAMLGTMSSCPQSNLLVLCGHTHGGGEVQLLDDLRVLTGEAVYGSPAIQQVLQAT